MLKDSKAFSGFSVNDLQKAIEQAVDELTSRGAQFEHYHEGGLVTDEKGISRGGAQRLRGLPTRPGISCLC
jgi:hypothetical protein